MNDMLRHKGYIAEVHFSPEDDVFYGQLLGIDALVNFEADTVAGLKLAFKEAVEDYLHTCKEMNKQPEKSFKGSFNVRISTQLHKDAAMIAAIKKISLNDYVKSAIDAAVNREKWLMNDDGSAQIVAEE